MKHLLPALAFLLSCCQTAFSQTASGSRWMQYADSVNKAATGREYMPYSLHTRDGDLLCTENGRNKVTMLVFWYPTCHCWNYEELNKLYESLKDDAQFRMAAVTFEQNMVAGFLEQEDFRLPIAFVRWQNDCVRLNYGNGFPSFVIIDKKGRVARLGVNKLGDNAEYGHHAVADIRQEITTLLEQQE